MFCEIVREKKNENKMVILTEFFSEVGISSMKLKNKRREMRELFLKS